MNRFDGMDLRFWLGGRESPVPEPEHPVLRICCQQQPGLSQVVPILWRLLADRSPELDLVFTRGPICCLCWSMALEREAIHLSPAVMIAPDEENRF